MDGWSWYVPLDRCFYLNFACIRGSWTEVVEKKEEEGSKFHVCSSLIDFVLFRLLFHVLVLKFMPLLVIVASFFFFGCVRSLLLLMFQCVFVGAGNLTDIHFSFRQHDDSNGFDELGPGLEWWDLDVMSEGTEMARDSSDFGIERAGSQYWSIL